MYKLSVVVIGYNIEKYIEKCLRSLQSQIYKNFEIIFVDDGSKEYLYNYVQREGSLTKSLDLDIIQQKERTIERMKDFYLRENQLLNYSRELEDLEIRYNIYIYRKFLKFSTKNDNIYMRKLKDDLMKIKLEYILKKSRIPLRHKLYLILLKCNFKL